jgi:hypothetical protein
MAMAPLDHIAQSELRLLLDEAAIRRLLSLYPRAVDRHDWDLLSSLFFEDAIDEHGEYSGSAPGFVEHMRRRSAAGVYWMHVNGTQIIEVKGDLAWTETYTLAFRRNRSEQDEVRKDTFLRIRYLDRLEKRRSEWRIAHRRVVYGPCQTSMVEADFLPPGTLIREGGYPDDPVYAALLADRDVPSENGA